MATTYGQVSATTAAAKVCDGDKTAPSQVRVHNGGTADAVFGPSGVTATTGFVVASGTSDTVPLDEGDSLYVITASGTAAVSWSLSRSLQRGG